MSASDSGSSCSSLTVDDGVLLYYKYVPFVDVPTIVRWYKDLCSELKLVGRVRVASEGVNVTVGGSTQALEEHIQHVCNHPGLGKCDFKVARCKGSLLVNPVLVRECGFDALSVRAVKELVSLGNDASHVSHALAGRHMSPNAFHHHLLAAAAGDNEHGVVILDARNVYETRIGRFQKLPGIEFYDPQIRQFSDLPAWLDANEERLRDKHVFMYCTGGVRCERASAYLRVKGSGFQNVYQLSGGIQRYLEAFPDGGLFAGKNFVFDPRVAVGSSDERKVGRCLECRSPYDDYAPRCRCSRCRLLVLVCGTCRTESASADHVCELCWAGEREDSADGRKAAPTFGATEEVNWTKPGVLERGIVTQGPVESIGCEVGRKAGPQQSDDNKPGTLAPHERKIGRFAKEGSQVSELAADQGEEALSAGLAPRRRLRVLCLHGFRQTGRGLRGRLAAFQWNLRDLVELVFVDGPFQLPCLYYPGEAAGVRAKEKQPCRRQGGEEAVNQGANEGGFGEGAPRGRAERDERTVGGRGESIKGRGASERRELSGYKAAGRGKEEGDRRRGAPGSQSPRKEEVGDAASRGPFPKFAWLVSPEQLQEICPSVESADSVSRVPVEGVPGDPSERLDGENLAGARAGEVGGEGEVVSRDWRPAAARFGPLQYLTQTAGWDTSLAHLQRVFSEQGPFDGVLGFSQGAAIAAALCRHMGEGAGATSVTFNFVILCSGFASPAERPAKEGRGLMKVPSLHVFGNVKENDRQIHVEESEKLAERFVASGRLTVRHTAGHIVPTSKSYVKQYRGFLAKHL